MFSQLVVKFLLLCVIFAVVIDACQVTVKLRSKTNHKFRVQVYVPSIEQKSEKILFTKPGDKKITVTGENCTSLPWVVRTWKQNEQGEWIHAKEVKAKLDGRGWLRVIVGDDYMPFFMDRSGVSCSEGFCG
uniref:Uncharacterized protein n=1 Tax=Panagrolaimus sp. PS1159 TaxID=55785 RepID=A0AC35GP75_9BILA